MAPTARDGGADTVWNFLVGQQKLQPAGALICTLGGAGGGEVGGAWLPNRKDMSPEKNPY